MISSLLQGVNKRCGQRICRACKLVPNTIATLLDPLMTDADVEELFQRTVKPNLTSLDADQHPLLLRWMKKARAGNARCDSQQLHY
jgi:hypothetical protein